jgi:transglutaminase-like putative cysteine protease
MRISTILLSLCFTVATFSQDYDFGKVSKEELEEKFNPLDSAASATYLYEYRKTFFEFTQSEGFQLITEIHKRVKIYNQEGFKYANESIRLYKSNSSKEKVTNIKGYTFNLLDGKVKETKLTKDGIFETELSKYFDETKFTMPNIQPGSVVEYKYRITSPFYSNVDEFVFQHDIPVKKIEASFEAPEYFNFKVNTKGFLVVTPQTDTRKDRITVKSKSMPQQGGHVDKWEDELEFIKYTSLYNLENIPALKDEPYVNNIDNYRSAVKYELSYVKMPQSPIDYYSTSWEDVVKTIYRSSSFGEELDKSGYYEDDIDALISTISDPMKRAAVIFNFVKSKVKWNGYYGYYTNDGVKKAFKDQVGNVAEINLILTSMLRYAGLKAYPVLVSTRQNGIPLFPTREGYNYVVTYVNFPEGIVLLDATSKYSMPNVLPFRVLNWQGRVMAEHGGSELIDLYPKEVATNTVSMMLNLNVDGDIEGGLRSFKTHHNALFYRENYNNVNEDDFLEKLENKYGGLEISDFTVSNALDLGKPIVESYKFTKESQADIIGDKIYFSPLFFLRTKENPFKLETREFPVDFGYPSSSKYMINIKLPEGYKIESMPESGVITLPDDLGMFKYIVSTTESKIQLVIETTINQSIITPLYYDILKTYFSQLVEKENEQIVLTRI